jgi:hypothetical protein
MQLGSGEGTSGGQIADADEGAHEGRLPGMIRGRVFRWTEPWAELVFAVGAIDKRSPAPHSKSVEVAVSAISIVTCL